ncbi:MAG TPA: Hpt domain-containing protein [Edaphobacter sp.]|nr:Hpt domain-containing protein [Edaphobacter sp.]
MLADLWERGLPLLRERLNLLDRAAAAADTGDLSEGLRVEAAGIAHKFAGSLGMLGYDRGTEIARRIEQILSASPAVSSRLGELVRELRETLRIH